MSPTRTLIWGAVVLAVIAPLVVFLLRPGMEDGRTNATQERLREQLAQSLPDEVDDAGNTGDPVVRRQERAVRPATPVAKAVAVGEPLGTIRIPRFGKDWEWVLLEGAADEVIANGPGRYSDTVLPGERGNVGIAAHRAGHGDPFIDFDLLVPGDLVRITQGKTTWTYRITTEPEIVPIDATWVLQPHTRQGSEEFKRELTLTTCWPKYGSDKRMYVTAILDQVVGNPGSRA